MHITHDHIQGRHDQQGDKCREQDTESQADGHGDQETRLNGFFEYHGCQAEKCGQRCQHDRPKTSDTRVKHCVEGIQPLFTHIQVGRVHQQQGIVDHNA